MTPSKPLTPTETLELIRRGLAEGLVLHRIADTVPIFRRLPVVHTPYSGEGPGRAAHQPASEGAAMTPGSSLPAAGSSSAPDFDFSHLGKDEAIEAAVEVMRRVSGSSSAPTADTAALAAVITFKANRPECDCGLQATLDATQAVEPCRHDAKWLDSYTRWAIEMHEQRKSEPGTWSAARSSSAPAELDAAWKEAEEALPEGWWIRDVARDGNATLYRWQADAVGPKHWEEEYGEGSTPAAALIALAATLARRLTSSPENPR